VTIPGASGAVEVSFGPSSAEFAVVKKGARTWRLGQ
jgi:hypothetical protein